MKTKTIILIRHGIAEGKFWPKSDYDRELVEEGRCELLKNAEKNKDDLQKIECVYCSGSVRTRQTLDVISPYLNKEWYDIIFDDCIFEKEGYRWDLLDLITSTKDNTASIALIGHNPTISELYAYLMQHDAYSMKKGDIIVITCKKRRKDL